MFYLLEADTSGSTKAARFSQVYAGKKIMSECEICHAQTFEPTGVIAMEVNPERGAFWPDAIKCFGSFQGLYLSQRVKEDLDTTGARYGSAFAAKVQGQAPKKLQNIPPPDYFYIAGEMGAKFDFAHAGMTVDSRCSLCGCVTRKAQEVGKRRFVEGSWNGADIFYTDLSPSSYYCTDRILEMARLQKWTNFRFVPIEEAHGYELRGIDYLAK